MWYCNSSMIAMHQGDRSGKYFCRTFLVTVRKTISAVRLIAAAARHASQRESDDVHWKKRKKIQLQLQLKWEYSEGTYSELF